MAKLTDYYLKPGTTIGAVGLPGGKISAEKTPEYISEEHAKIIGPSLDYLLSVGKVGKGRIEPETEPEDEDDTGENGSGKSAKRIELETQAAELGIEFDDKTTQKQLKTLIEEFLAK